MVVAVAGRALVFSGFAGLLRVIVMPTTVAGGVGIHSVTVCCLPPVSVIDWMGVMGAAQYASLAVTAVNAAVKVGLILEGIGAVADTTFQNCPGMPL